MPRIVTHACTSVGPPSSRHAPLRSATSLSWAAALRHPCGQPPTCVRCRLCCRLLDQDRRRRAPVIGPASPFTCIHPARPGSAMRPGVRATNLATICGGAERLVRPLSLAPRLLAPLIFRTHNHHAADNSHKHTRLCWIARRAS